MKKIFAMLLALSMLLTGVSVLAAEPIRVELNYAPLSFEQDPVIVNNRTMVPVRAVSESFGCSVKWSAEERLVSIVTGAYQEKIENALQFGAVNVLQDGEKTGTVAFGIAHFSEYEVKEHTADGTDVEISYATENGNITLNVRTDLYDGVDSAITDAYAKSVAEGIVSVLGGHLISAEKATLGGVDMVKIRYTASGIVHGVTDTEPDITIYTGRKNGVVYTVTYSVFGEIPEAVIGDFNYMLSSLMVV